MLTTAGNRVRNAPYSLCATCSACSYHCTNIPSLCTQLCDQSTLTQAWLMMQLSG